ncbi:hypothetical protein BDZ89DRAFT_1128841 [Hymenopellis radicata]|nr:hypothetical protein BDZ89DRAFT_1128841 [Hymenopellis radicata]
MEGEFRLSKDLRSTSDIGCFSVSYSVVLNPFTALGKADPNTKPLAIVPVEIATMHAKGPRAQFMPRQRTNSHDSRGILVISLI